MFIALVVLEMGSYLRTAVHEALNPSVAAHLCGAMLVIAGLPAQLRGRWVLSRMLVLFGVAVAHLPDLATTLIH